jgi:hypothetical protein
VGRPRICRVMSPEQISPELVLVDPELGARARAALPHPAAQVRAPVPVAAPAAQPTPPPRPYPVWARMTAALWLVVLGILIGGTAIPHAQDRPRVIPPAEDVTICERPATPTTPTRPPTRPLGPVGP